MRSKRKSPTTRRKCRKARSCPSSAHSEQGAPGDPDRAITRPRLFTSARAAEPQLAQANCSPSPTARLQSKQTSTPRVYARTGDRLGAYSRRPTRTEETRKRLTSVTYPRAPAQQAQGSTAGRFSFRVKAVLWRDRRAELLCASLPDRGRRGWNRPVGDHRSMSPNQPL